MADTRLGKIGITVKEPWSENISYEALDVTLFAVEDGGDGCSYTALRDNIGVTPGTDPNTWVKSTQAGQSIYDLAVKYHHFVGTEEEFEAEYQAVLQAARDAAAGASAVEAQVEAAEALRVAAETSRADAESTRQSAEASRASAETARGTAEAARQSAESGRASAETARVTAEQGRVSAESDRVSAEAARATAETDRVSDFSALKTDMETAIGQADAATAAAVTTNNQIQTAEASRVSAEQGRVSAENARASAESARATAETGRATAETARATAEGQRATAEGQRVTAENARVSAESGRDAAESARVTAEASRVSAETARESQASSDHTTSVADHAIVQGYDTRLTNVEDEVSQLGQELNGGENLVDLSPLTEQAGVISGGVWSGVGSIKYKHVYLPVIPGEVYKITSRTDIGTNFAAFKTADDAVQGAAAPFCDACYDTSVAANTSVYLTVPEDCYFLYIKTLSNGTVCTPSVYKVETSRLSSAREDEIGYKERYYTSQLRIYGGIIGSGKWVATAGTSYQHIFVPVTPGQVIEIKSQQNVGTAYALLTVLENSPVDGSTPSFCEGFTNSISVPANSSVAITIPQDAAWLFIVVKYNGVDRTPILNKKTLGSINREINEMNLQIESINAEIDERPQYPITFDTDRQTTRLKIPVAKRKTGVILYYIENGEIVIEEYKGNLFTDVQWKANDNWISKEDDFRFYDGVSASIKSLDINLVEVNGEIDTLRVIQITQYYVGDENYYLAVSIDNNVRTAVLSTGQNLLTFSTSTKSVKISINISSLSSIVINKYFRKEYIELVQLKNKVDSIAPYYWDDSLRISKHSLLNVDSGTYGNSGAKYGFSLKNGCSRFAVDFKINADVNTTHGDIEIAKIGDTSIKIICAAPELLKESYVNDTASYVQELKYKSGFKVGSSVHTRAARGTTPLVGDVALMLWLKGSTSSMTLANLQTREQWLENNQDYILKIENNTLSIERNGIGNNGETFNGGATSTVFSTSLLSGGDYKTVGALYNELSALDYLVVRMINTDARKTCGDLAQFGTVRMVGCYNQQLDVESSSTDYYFDSYPIPLRYKKDENWHTLEVIYVGGSAYIYIDGYMFTAETSSDVSIGSSDIALRNLEVWDGIYGDDAVFNDDKSQFSSKRTPSLFAFMGHYTYDNYEGNGSQPSDSTNQTSSRLESVCSMLKKYDYKVINLDDFGNIPSQKRVSYFGNKVAMFIFDDLSFVPLYMNKVTRAHVSRYGFPMNFAVIHSRLQADTDAQDAVLPMRLNGWCCATHSLRHDVPIPRKNSINLYNELMQILDDCDKYRFVNNIFVYNWSGAWCNSYNMLKMCGYVAAIDSSGGVMHPYCNQYNLPRYNVVDNSHTLAEVEANLVK